MKEYSQYIIKTKPLIEIKTGLLLVKVYRISECIQNEYNINQNYLVTIYKYATKHKINHLFFNMVYVEDYIKDELLRYTETIELY
jgi:hypothetical protein